MFRGAARLNARRLVTEHDVGRLAARRTIVVRRGGAPIFDHAFHRGNLLHPIRHVAAAAATAAEVPERRSAGYLDRVDVTDAQLPLPLQRALPAHLLVTPVHEVVDAYAPLAQQRLAGRQQHGPREDVRPIEVAHAVTAIALQRPREHVHPVEVADAHAALALLQQRRSRQHLGPVVLADAHAAVALQWRGPRQHVRAIEVVDAGPTVTLQQPRRLADRLERPDRVAVPLLVVVLRDPLHQHQRLQIERALGASRHPVARRQ